MTNPNSLCSQGIIPHLQCSDAAGAIEFYKKAFGATETSRMPAIDGKRIMHAALSFGGHSLFIADEFPEYCNGKSNSPQALGGTPITLHRYVEDCDAAIARAEQAGATVTMPATDMFWGDRYGVVTDPFGFSWSLATHLRDVGPEEAMQNYREMVAQFEKKPG